MPVAPTAPSGVGSTPTRDAVGPIARLLRLAAAVETRVRARHE